MRAPEGKSDIHRPCGYKVDNAVQGVERLWKDCGLHFSTRYFRFLKWENAINTCGEKLVLALGKHVDNCAENLKVSLEGWSY